MIRRNTEFLTAQLIRYFQLEGLVEIIILKNRINGRLKRCISSVFTLKIIVSTTPVGKRNIFKNSSKTYNLQP